MIKQWALALPLVLGSALAAPVSMPNAGFESDMTGFTTFGTVQSRTAFGTYFPNEGVRMAWAETSAADETAGFTWQAGSLQVGDILTFVYRALLAEGSSSSFWLDFRSPDMSDSVELVANDGWTIFEYTIPGSGGGDPTRFSSEGTFIKWSTVNVDGGTSFLLVDAPKENTTSEPATLALVSLVLGLMILSRQQQHTVSTR